MKSEADLLEEVIEQAVDGETAVATLLRKCRLLSERFGDESFTEWVLKELNGYDDWKGLPEYRVVHAGAKGFMVGPMGAQINAQPLASVVLEEEHRHFAEKAFFRDAASAYENLKEDGDGGYRVEWPADLVVKYQSSFIRNYALNRAWQDIPAYALRAIPETVTNRILEFGLSLRKQFGDELAGERAEIKEHVGSLVQTILKGK